MIELSERALVTVAPVVASKFIDEQSRAAANGVEIVAAHDQRTAPVKVGRPVLVVNVCVGWICVFWIEVFPPPSPLPPKFHFQTVAVTTQLVLAQLPSQVLEYSISPPSLFCVSCCLIFFIYFLLLLASLALHSYLNLMRNLCLNSVDLNVKFTLP